MQNSNYLFEESGASEHDIPNEFSDEEFGDGKIQVGLILV